MYGTINDDPAFFFFSGQTRCRFGSRETPGGGNGISSQTIGPIDPRCKIDTSGALQYKPNPFNAGDTIPILINKYSGVLGTGSAELPARPASQLLQTDAPQKGISRGVYYPSGVFSRFLQQDKDSDFAQNFSAGDLAWNRGGSQQDEKEFKEGYLDMEFFDSRLWVRAGRQNIVWGK
ncbi:MAG: hypothetical protein H6Q91_3104, partial [Deltaproteobacteria bacterium]|nr:hypothetical protein [Deltaproteobacteria bacterium]